MVATNKDLSELSCQIYNFIGICSIADQVAEAIHRIGSSARNVGEYSFQSWKVPVNVAEDRYAHFLIRDCSSRPN